MHCTRFNNSLYSRFRRGSGGLHVRAENKNEPANALALILTLLIDQSAKNTHLSLHTAPLRCVSGVYNDCEAVVVVL